jgi:hypothetical protein
LADQRYVQKQPYPYSSLVQPSAMPFNYMRSRNREPPVPFDQRHLISQRNYQPSPYNAVSMPMGACGYQNPNQCDVDLAARIALNAARVCEPTCTWSGQLPAKELQECNTYSCKVFVGGVPWDVTEGKRTFLLFFIPNRRVSKVNIFAAFIEARISYLCKCISLG